MWECKEVVCVLAEWEKEPRSGNRNREVGMEENSGRGVDWMRDRVICCHGMPDFSGPERLSYLPHFLMWCFSESNPVVDSEINLVNFTSILKFQNRIWNK